MIAIAALQCDLALQFHFSFNYSRVKKLDGKQLQLRRQDRACRYQDLIPITGICKPQIAKCETHRTMQQQHINGDVGDREEMIDHRDICGSRR